MCGFCALLGGSGRHWSDGAPGAAVPGAWRRERIAMARRLNRVLAAYGLAVDDWQGGTLVISSRTGASALVADMGALWPAAERLARRRPDPLDPDLLDRLARTSGAQPDV